MTLRKLTQERALRVIQDDTHKVRHLFCASLYVTSGFPDCGSKSRGGEYIVYSGALSLLELPLQ